MCWVLCKLESGLSQSLDIKLWNDFLKQKIPSDDGIKILANGGTQELWMHKSVITKISGSGVLQDSPQDIYKQLGFSNLLGSNLPSDGEDYIDSKPLDIGTIERVAKLMYFGFTRIHRIDVQLFLSACRQFKIRNLNPVDSGEVEQIMMVGGAEDEHQSDVRVTDGGHAMDINEQREADLGASGGHQPGESNTDDRASYNEINELRVNPSRQEQQSDSEMNPPRQEQLSDSEMNPPRQEQQPDSEMNPPRQEQQPDSEMNPPREETQPASDMTPVRRSSRKRAVPKRFKPWS